MVTKKIVVQGLVQGIGFRPFVAELAEQLHIEGWVRNTNGIVTILARAEDATIAQLMEKIKSEAPVGAVVEHMDWEAVSIADENADLPKIQDNRFVILESNKTVCESPLETKQQTKTYPLIPADLPTCDHCRQELQDKNNRRYRHPFISCTVCGPRYSIIREIPYDREHIVMDRFPMCPKCQEEYLSKGNIRRHAQTIACKECGPTLSFLWDNGTDRIHLENELAIQAAIDHIKQGGILAIKDIGGFHLAVNPFNETAIDRLRILKGREAKPFAVMFSSVDGVEEYCSLDDKEKDLLLSPARPIVLLRKKEQGKALHEKVCGTSPDIGAMLPCNPVQILLAEAFEPLIMTSANVTGALITTANEQMEQWLADGVAILEHDRPILTPLDDSIVRIVNGKKQTLRRARGLVPLAIPFPEEEEIFATGGDLKSVFCYTGGGRAYLSQHLGDLEEESCFAEFVKQTKRMKQLFGFEPLRWSTDWHPGYRSVAFAKEHAKELPLYNIQHHKAHVASVIAEHDLKGTVLGFAFDGTGYGDDGTIWGSEVFLWSNTDGTGYCMKRMAHLTPVLLMGGDEGTKNADTILYGYLSYVLKQQKDNRLQKALEQLEQSDRINLKRLGIVESAIRHQINCVTSTSMGRLFDAISALLGICHYNSYEGQAPIELENLATTVEAGYPLHIAIYRDCTGYTWQLDTTELFYEIIMALANGYPTNQLARGFIEAVADAVVALSKHITEEEDQTNQVVLSGGTFLNRILLERTILQLEAENFCVFRNEEVPPGDGGICLGQAYLAAKETQ